MVSSMTMMIGTPDPSGLAHHNAAIIGTIRPTTTASRILRRPSLSIDAPRKGAVSITAHPVYCVHCEITAWPRTGSPTITEPT